MNDFVRRNKVKRRGGFTSTEFIIVLEIIGILTVIIMIVFFNIQSNARQVSIENLKVAIEKAATLVHGKAALIGLDQVEKASVFSIDTAYGYPSTHGITQAVQNFEQDWVVLDMISPNKETISISFKRLDPVAQSRCHLTYTQATNKRTVPLVHVFCNE